MNYCQQDFALACNALHDQKDTSNLSHGVNRPGFLPCSHCGGNLLAPMIYVQAKIYLVLSYLTHKK